MSIRGEYYLHENRSVIYKPHMGSIEPDSPFVIRQWPASEIGDTPNTFVNWLAELRILGANQEEIYRLADDNHLNNWVENWETVVFGGNFNEN